MFFFLCPKINTATRIKINLERASIVLFYLLPKTNDKRMVQNKYSMPNPIKIDCIKKYLAYKMIKH